jgi:hypothetical protein
MSDNKTPQGNRNAGRSAGQPFDKDQPHNPGQRDRSQADERGEGLRKKPETDAAIPELDEPDVEGVGNEGRSDADATMPPGQGQNPRRNTM